MIRLFQVPSIDVDAAMLKLREVLTSGYTGEGPRCRAFEQAVSERLGMETLYVNSCTSALLLALHLAGARSGTDVITTAQTCIATNLAIAHSGARLVWADIDPETGNLDPDDVARKVGPRTVAVVAVDWGGRLCDFIRLREVLRGLTTIEDAAQAFGAVRSSETHRGAFVCYSFQSIKHVSTADGGGLVCPSRALTERARLLRWFGLDRGVSSESMRCYQVVSEAGFKMQGNDVLASLGLESLRGVDERLRHCRANAEFYLERLSNVPHVKLPPRDRDSAWWFFGIRVSKPVRFAAFMAESAGVETGQVNARNDLQPCFGNAVRSALPGLEEFSAHQTNLPCGAHITEPDRERVARAVEAWSARPEARW